MVNYRETTAADDLAEYDEYDEDGAEVVWVDSYKSSQSSWLDDFDFRTYRDERDDDFDRVGSIWSRYAQPSHDRAERIIAAQKLVQGFVDTFATGDKPYAVTFDENIGTAGTDFDARKVIISHKPLFDPTITPDQANEVMTAMACHESSHVRYGLKTAAAARALIARDQRASDLANVLDDVRIERRFVRDYPGYDGIFAPATRYVCETMLREIGVTKLDPAKISPVNLAGSAVRYSDYVAWTPETEPERDWWLDWAERWSRTDKPADHVAGVEEGLARLDQIEQQRQQEREQQEAEREQQEAAGESQSESEGGEKGDEQGDDAGTSAGGEGAEQSDEKGASDAQGESGSESQSGEQQGEGEGQGSSQSPSGSSQGDAQGASDETGAPSGTSQGYGRGFPVCIADGIDEAATANGAEKEAGESTDAQALVEDAKSLVQDPVLGAYGEINLSAAGVAKRRATIVPNPAATASIRAAFARSRTGHFNTERGYRSGRLDNRSLPRIASSDFRLFAKRTGQSEGKYLVWLLVDVSGSMHGYAIESATSVAASLAAAARFLPNVSLDIWAWTTPQRTHLTPVTFSATRVYHSGDPIANVGYLPRVPQGGTPDAETLAWAAKAIRAATPRGVEPVIIIASDGSGSLASQVGNEHYDRNPAYAANGIGTNRTYVSDLARTYGVRIVSVAIGRAVSEDFQRRAYGDRNYIAWQGSIARTAKPLGDLVARIASGHGA